MARASAPGSGASMALATALVPRALAGSVFGIVAWWVFQLLGGVSTQPEAGGKTGRLFNWHPLLMVLAFVVLMSEALLAYRVPWRGTMQRPQRKVVHWLCHSAAVICVCGALSAVWRSHDLAQPPIPNLYSPHSFLGMAAVCLLALQFGVGFTSYLWPKGSEPFREWLGPWHRFLGQATYLAGLGAVASGLQEKAGFLQTLGGKPVYSAYIHAPAWAAALLVPLALSVLAPQAAGLPQQPGGGGGGGGGGARPLPGQHRPLPDAEEIEEGVAAFGLGGRC